MHKQERHPVERKSPVPPNFPLPDADQHGMYPVPDERQTFASDGLFWMERIVDSAIVRGFYPGHRMSDPEHGWSLDDEIAFRTSAVVTAALVPGMAYRLTQDEYGDRGLEPVDEAAMLYEAARARENAKDKAQERIDAIIRDSKRWRLELEAERAPMVDGSRVVNHLGTVVDRAREAWMLLRELDHGADASTG